mmetsp:Transcript_12615/g.19127  ORF Transcript_12615/g.19127 Transcript_12615/m.19127 type:complete len:166 (-) Transcript_12615:2-499(-)
MAILEALKSRRFKDALALVKEMTWVFVNIKDERDWTMLHHAAALDRPEICRALMERPDFTEDAGVDKESATALHIAAAGEKAKCCKEIVTGGGSRFSGVNVLDQRRRTALHLAALRGSQECYDAICLHPDCHMGLPDLTGKTAPELAVERGVEVELSALNEEVEL